MPGQVTQYRAMDDRALVVAFKAGEPGAYDEMYRRYSDRVRAICRRMLANPEDAQEAVQETFLKAYLGLPQFNGSYKLGAWLGRIASNVCLDALRARGRVLRSVPLNVESPALGVETSPEDLVVGDAPDVGHNIAQIQPLHARALVMRGVEGLSHREIAGRLRMSPAQVKALLHRARRSFKRSWDEAKGWVLAPLVALRSLSREDRAASAAGSPVASLAAGAGPLMAERVAASAVMVAVALSGLPAGTPATSNGAGASLGHRPLRAIERQLAERRPVRHERVARPGAAHTDEATAPAAPQSAPVKSALVAPALQRMLNRTGRDIPHRARHHAAEGDGALLPDAGPIEPVHVVKRVSKDVQGIIRPS